VVRRPFIPKHAWLGLQGGIDVKRTIGDFFLKIGVQNGVSYTHPDNDPLYSAYMKKQRLMRPKGEATLNAPHHLIEVVKYLQQVIITYSLALHSWSMSSTPIISRYATPALANPIFAPPLQYRLCRPTTERSPRDQQYATRSTTRALRLNLDYQ
jgi:hypothetical protein